MSPARCQVGGVMLEHIGRSRHHAWQCPMMTTAGGANLGSVSLLQRTVLAVSRQMSSGRLLRCLAWMTAMAVAMGMMMIRLPDTALGWEIRAKHDSIRQ